MAAPLLTPPVLVARRSISAARGVLEDVEVTAQTLATVGAGLLGPPPRRVLPGKFVSAVTPAAYEGRGVRDRRSWTGRLKSTSWLRMDVAREQSGPSSRNDRFLKTRTTAPTATVDRLQRLPSTTRRIQQPAGTVIGKGWSSWAPAPARPGSAVG
jgi:hypothetical protein